MNETTLSLRQKILAPRKPASGYEELVERALALHRQIASLAGERFVNHHASLFTSEKLTAAAFVRRACEIAKCDVAKLEAFKATIDAAPHEYPSIHSFVAAVAKRVSAVRHDQGALGEPPSENLIDLMDDGPDAKSEFLAMMVESARAGGSYLQAMALGVLIATKTAPKSVFGTADSLDEQRGRSEKLQEQLWRLCDQIPAVASTTWAWSDEGESLARVTYSWHGEDTGVAVGPLNGSGLRLVAHLAAQRASQLTREPE